MSKDSSQSPSFMIGLAKDPSLAWASACDSFRSKIVGLPAASGCHLYPSIEAALVEISMILAERERDIGGTKTSVVFAQSQDPALEQMSKMMSASGLDLKPKSKTEWASVATWLPELKSKALFVAHCEDDRFTGAVHDAANIRATVLADGVRVPLLSICFGSAASGHDWRSTLPRPFEIRLYTLVGGTARGAGLTIGQGTAPECGVLAVLGERLRFEPKISSYSMSHETLEALVRVAERPSHLPSELATLRLAVENFESLLPKPFVPWWPMAGTARMIDRAVVTSKEHDGSWVVDLLKEKLIANGREKATLESGLFSLSGCAMNDERRQEWLRARGDDPWLIRGCVHISADLIRSHGPLILAALKP